MDALTTDKRDQVVIFGADWCGDCRRTKSWLRRNNVAFTEYDTETDAVARERAITLSGRMNIPVVVAPDGTVLVEPTSVELSTTLAAYRRRQGRCR